MIEIGMIVFKRQNESMIGMAISSLNAVLILDYLNNFKNVY